MEGPQLPSHHASGLPQRLKTATQDLHRRAERSGAMAALLAGTLERAAYIALLANLRAIYAALERVLDDLPGNAPMFESLARRAALDADLRAFGASPEAQAPAPATLDYVARLDALRGPRSHLLWAHVYVRYLGDLHGGQILGPRVRKLYRVAEGTRFYDFGDDDRVRRLRSDLRTHLAQLQLDATQADQVVAEATWAFEAHCRIFEQLSATT